MEWMGEEKRGRRKRLSLVQVHLNQSIEPDSQTAVAYVLKAEAREESEMEGRERGGRPAKQI